MGSGDNPLDKVRAFGFASGELLNAKETELLLVNGIRCLVEIGAPEIKN